MAARDCQTTHLPCWKTSPIATRFLVATCAGLTLPISVGPRILKLMDVPKLLQTKNHTTIMKATYSLYQSQV
ncbi:hypothetical protein DPMN_192261 [Dreissena polymorpha]|uniref:Uncharacterized protein n=1 Tax=Dreissena polymorpha TaxID=45954 RepID=A0A9D3Y1C3_DREPO|nr:hypothetical protein DPMN_192261 [Dreissena polymorpha]